MKRKPPPSQGIEIDPISVPDLVATPDFRAGFADRTTGRPPRCFDGNWLYEYGRQCCNGIIAAHVDPQRLSKAKQAQWAARLFADGTIQP